MAKIIEFAAPVKEEEIPDYTGRMLTLNPEKARKFQCGGFVLGPRHMCDVVSPRAQMGQIHRALQEEILLDITDAKKGVQTKYSNLSAVEDQDTEQKVYFGSRKQFLDLDLECLAYITQEDRDLDDQVCICTSDPAEQKILQARIDENRRSLVLPPGMDNPDKYLLKVTPE